MPETNRYTAGKGTEGRGRSKWRGREGGKGDQGVRSRGLSWEGAIFLSL